MTCPFTEQAAAQVESTLNLVIAEHGADAAVEISQAFFAAWAAGVIRTLGQKEAREVFYRLADMSATEEIRV